MTLPAAGRGKPTDKTMIPPETNYRPDGDCSALVNYIDKAQGVRNRRGEKLDEQEKNEFVRWSKSQEMNRQVVISPDPDAGEQLSNEQLSLHTRETMSEYLDDRQEASYVYSIHQDTDVPHAQVAMAGSRDSLEMYQDEIEEMRQTAEEKFDEEALIEQAEAKREEEAQAAQKAESRAQSQRQYIRGDD